MATLSIAKRQTQIILKWLGIFLAVIFVILLGIRFLSFVKKIMTPPAPPKASFGKLPKISFPNQQKENIIYSLNTLTGFLPSFSDRANVYKITPVQPTLLALEKTREKVAKADFTSNETKIAEDVYQWMDPSSSLQKRITINIFSSDFTISSTYLTSALQNLNSDEKEISIDTVSSFLSRLNLFPQDLDTGKTKTNFYSIDRGTLIPTPKSSDVKIMKVNFFQKDVARFPIYYEKGLESSMNLSIGKESGELKVVDARFFHKNISQEKSDYAIKSATQAFSELKEGKGYIASKDPNIVEVTVRKVSLGYYIGEDEQDVLMPIVVFEGDNNFLAYVSAIKDEWINN